MKRLLIASLLANAALLAAFFATPLGREPSASAQAVGGRGGAVAGNGDVNGSGGIDISDAVFLLNWLFSGGPDPAPCPVGGGLPDTGQDQCFDCDGVRIPCNSCIGKPRPCDGFTAKQLSIQDAMQSTGCPDDASRFTIHPDDDTVTDNCTGLQWQRFTADSDDDGTPDPMTWCDALSYCDALSFAGHQDWRLPNIRELQSIVDYGRLSPSIGGSFVSERGGYWSSTTAFHAPAAAWLISFENGAFDFFGKGADNIYVRAVRNAR